MLREELILRLREQLLKSVRRESRQMRFNLTVLVRAIVIVQTLPFVSRGTPLNFVLLACFPLSSGLEVGRNRDVVSNQ